jgi:quercetin dioxygenase-like cupin family protein
MQGGKSKCSMAKNKLVKTVNHKINNVPALSGEIEKGKIHIIVEIIEYVPQAVVSKTIIKKSTGNVTVSSFDAGEELAEKISPFDVFIQIIDGSAEVVIDEKKFRLKLGEGIIIPAHANHCFNANVQFKMIATIIKSGYED